MNNKFKFALALGGMVFAAQAAAQVTFYEGESFQGRSFTVQQPIPSLERYGFNDRASSAVVAGDRWEVCDETQFRGNCQILRPGRYPSLASLGLNDRVSSARAAGQDTRLDNDRYSPAAGQITFYENDNFRGRSFSSAQDLANFKRVGYNDRASSVEVVGERWQVCDDEGYRGRCVVLRPGRYPSLNEMGLNDRVSSARAMNEPSRVERNRRAPSDAHVTFYEHDGFAGRSFTSDRDVQDFRQSGFNDKASSVDVVGDRWEVCDDIGYGGRCVVLRPGRYQSLTEMGLNDRISSVRELTSNARIDENRYAPPATQESDPRGDYRRRSQ